MGKDYSFSVHGDRYWQWALKMVLSMLMFPITIVLAGFGVDFDLN